MHCAANIRNFSQKFAARCKFLPFLDIFCSALHFPCFYKKFRNEEFHNRNFVYNWIRTSAPAYVEQSLQTIYHPSRFAIKTHINLLIYRYFNSVIDTPKTGISITLSLTIWRYPSRFSHHQIPHTVVETLAVDEWHLRKFAAKSDEIAQLQR